MRHPDRGLGGGLNILRSRRGDFLDSEQDVSSNLEYLTTLNTTAPTPEPPQSFLTRLVLAARLHPATYALIGAEILLADLFTGPYIELPILSVFPIALSAWFCSPRFSYGLGILIAFGHFLIAVFLDRPAPLPYMIANSLIRSTALCLVTWVGIRAREAAALRAQVRMLEGILPICSFCKSIRDEAGNWTQLEAYISHHSEADFSHGFCPTCARKHYGEFLDAPDSPESSEK
jgi:hypothetical protein